MPRIIILSNPRSGSTYLEDLLNCHPEIELAGELLNDDGGRCLVENPAETVSSTLAGMSASYAGFKLFPDQVYIHNLNFGQLVESLGVTHVIILWRENILEGYTSLQIALKDGVWYSTSKADHVKTMTIDPEIFQRYVDRTINAWIKIFQEWPNTGIKPIFVKFETLIQQQQLSEIKRIIAELGCSSEGGNFVTPSQRQNPAPLHEKVENFAELPSSLLQIKLNVENMFKDNVKEYRPEMNEHVRDFAPDMEPAMPIDGWRYRVAEPYLPALAKQNAMDAVNSGSISSAGYWPKELSKRLRALFKVPSAQPCCNGFSALLVALQVAGIGKGDDVLVPSMTMVAVPNAVHYLSANPIFVDNAKDAYNPSWNEYISAATPSTKAVIVTHTYGVPAHDIELISDECRSRGWILIEDVSESFGVTCSTSSGEEKLLGSFGDYSIASLYANKILHGGDGGFIIAKDPTIDRRLKSVVNHGFTPSFHFVHYEPSPNGKIHGIGAAIACGVIDKMEEIISHRSKLATWYRSRLDGLPLKLMPQCGPADSPWVFGVECESKEIRTKLRAHLALHQIETRDYFFALHLQPAYMTTPVPRSLPNAEQLGPKGFYLPSYTNLTESDVEFICSVVQNYFNPEASIKNEITRRKLKEVVQIAPDGFGVEVRSYRGSGEATDFIVEPGHIYLEAVKLGMDTQEALFHEHYDKVNILLDAIANLQAKSNHDPLREEMFKYFSPFVDYFKSQHILEQAERPWLGIDLKSFSRSEIPTTTEPETLQLLVWLIQTRHPLTIWEIGSWMGHATALMAEASPNSKIYACDAFRWQDWMSNYIQGTNLICEEGKSFLPLFEKNIAGLVGQVETVLWPYDINDLPNALANHKPGLIFLDISQQDEEIEEIWKLIEPSLIPGETIILFNGLVTTSIPFFTRHSSHLVSFAKPNTIAKAFLFTGETEIKGEEEVPLEGVTVQKHVQFHSSPEWDHHNDNLFVRAIDHLKGIFHQEAPSLVTFVPAVEEAMCNDIALFQERPWIGIIHSTEVNPEFFYAPDLHRLCTRKKYLKAMLQCRGLFTLTTFQAEYLRAHLPPEFCNFPVQTISYPVEMQPQKTARRSIVPEMLKNNSQVEVLHVGSFARDFDFFFHLQLPENFIKVLVAGDDVSRQAGKRAPPYVAVVDRLSDAEYEEKLLRCVVILTLKYEGAANTLILECIARNIPILSPPLSSCIEYLGPDYPMFYNPNVPEEIPSLLTLENIDKAIQYLEGQDKTRFSYETFVSNVKNGAVMASVPAAVPTQYDITISICCFKRTHHLPRILESLWAQDFEGSFEVILWNNNPCREGLVQECASKYRGLSTSQKAIGVTSSTSNYYCSIRFAMASLMKGKVLLICDDDIIPGKSFVSFFHAGHVRQPKDILCVRGHEFLPHQLDVQNPHRLWSEYEHLRFRDDHEPEQLIHFVHADACLIPKEALHEAAAETMPDPSFTLVDDYWMSFILSLKYNRKLRKLMARGPEILERTADSETVGLALHTRPEVVDARMRLYVHHMVQGWPTWRENDSIMKVEAIKGKQNFWRDPHKMGYNISSEVSDKDIEDLEKLGVTLVRIGAVGVGEKVYFDLSDLQTSPAEEVERLKVLLGGLDRKGIFVVITLERRLASGETWGLIARELGGMRNLIGYDLMNEPVTEKEEEMHWRDVVECPEVDEGVPQLMANYKEMILEIRKFDKSTPIILEPSFWGKMYALDKFPVEDLLEVDPNLVVSVHFYEPMMLTWRTRNNSRFSYPGPVPVYDGDPDSEVIDWTDAEINRNLGEIKRWADEKGVPVFLGEFGICRDTQGAPEYLQAVINACHAYQLTGILFSFRDLDWEAMDYELGIRKENWESIWEGNPFWSVMEVK